MSRDRRKHKGRADSGGYFGIPHRVLHSVNYRALSAHAIKLLIDVGGQFRGNNNGDLSAAWRIMQPRGWKSRDTLCRALRELLSRGMIEKTRQGGLNRCSLYAITWRAIDECQGKLEVRATKVPSGKWNEPQPSTLVKQNASTAIGSHRHGGRASAQTEMPASPRQACQS